MKFSIIIFVVLAIVSVTTNNQTYDNNIKEMIEKLAQLTDATTDMPQKFEIISQRATPFVKLLGPVASLVALGLKISFNVGSDEYKAIKRLHELALNKFTKMEKMIELKAHEQMLMLMMMAYDEKVTLSIRTIEGLYKQVTMPDGDRRPFKSSFVHECKFGDTPRSALAWLNGVVNLNCRAMNEVQRRRATNYAKYIEIFTRFEKENKERPGEYYNQYRKQFFLKMSKMKSMTAKRMLNMMELRLREITEEQLGSKQIQNNTEKIYNAINETISLYDGYDFAYCLLDAVADARKWHRQAIYDLVDTIRQHAFKLAIIQSACINITYETPEEIDYHFDEMKTQLSGIMSKIADWLPIKLEKSWPTITAANILQNVGQDVDVKDPISMNRTAEKLQNEADLIGPQTYVHSVLVTAAGSESKFYQYNCDNTTCLYMGNIYGLNINVYQYNTGSIDHAKSADKWYKIFWFRIQQSISENFDPEDDMRTLFRKIEKDYPSLMNPKAFYNALLLSDSYPWMYPEIVVGIGVARIEGLSPVRNISFYSEEHPPRFYHIELYLHL